MNFSLVPLRSSVPRRRSARVGVYVELRELVGLQFKARGFSFLPRQPVHSVLAGRHASRLRGRGLNFEELRRYQVGDDVRAMDWKVTARTRQAHVRVFTEERDRAVLLLVDQRLHMFFGSRRAMKSVVAAEAAALGAWRALAVGDRVGGMVFNDERVDEMRPRRSRATVMHLLDTIVRQNHELRADSPIPANPAQLNVALQQATRLAPHDHLVVVVSDFQGADEATTRLTAQLARHNDVLGMLLFDPLRKTPPPAGRVVVSDGARQLEVDLDESRLRDRIARDYADELEAIRKALRKLSAPLIPLSTAEEVPVQIRRALGAAAARRR